MANIMVTEVCNLHCPYCFAGEFVNKTPKEMTLDDFRTALDFVLGDGTKNQVGIIGGEPTLYTYINEAMHIVMNDRRSFYAVLFTNAVPLERLDPEILRNPKLHMLVNCNSPIDMGETAFEKMRHNLLCFKNEYGGGNRFHLSVNIYKPDFDYSYLFPLLDDFSFNMIRISISVPQKGNLNGKMPLEYFKEMKPVTIRLIKDMLHRGVVPQFDCNFIPPCVFTSDEREELLNTKSKMQKSFDKGHLPWYWEQAIFCERYNCSPVIDILPDLRTIRCFGLSEYTKQNINDFSSISELRRHYEFTVDRPASEIWTDDACSGCHRRQNVKCSGGCLLFKADRIAIR